MKSAVLAVSLILSAALPVIAALPLYEPFADSTASGGTSYSMPGNVIGQSDAQGQSWTAAGPTPIVTQPTITNVNLSYTGLAPSTGGGALFGGNGTSARFNLGTTITSGTVYYSFLFNVVDATAMSSSGVFWFGFNNASGTQTTTPTTVGTRVITKANGSGFQIGLDKSSGSTPSFVFDPTVYNLNSTILIVGSYTFNTGTTLDDVSQLWLNPTSLGGADPGGALSSVAGTDLGAIASVVLFERNAAEPKAADFDELRVGTSFADVTPTTIPEPGFASLGVAGAMAFLGLRRRAQRS